MKASVNAQEKEHCQCALITQLKPHEVIKNLCYNVVICCNRVEACVMPLPEFMDGWMNG